MISPNPAFCFDLSICIPTFNRESELAILLESIFRSAMQSPVTRTQICISDNASTDNTQQMLSEVVSPTNVFIKYEYHAQNRGADANYLSVMKMADGEYTWLMGSDDSITVNSIADIMLTTKSYSSSIYIFDRYETRSIASTKNLKKRSWANTSKNLLFVDGSNLSLAQYVHNLTSLGGLFSYLGSIVYKTNLIELQLSDFEFNKLKRTAYLHAYLLIRAIISKGSTLSYFPKAFAICLIGNDSFIEQRDYLSRVNLDVNGYKTIINLLNISYDLSVEILDLCAREQSLSRLSMIFYKKQVFNLGWLLPTLRHLKYIGVSSTKIYISLLLGALLSILPTKTLDSFYRLFRSLK